MREIVPGFPEIISYEPRCNVCGLASNGNGDVLRYIHQLADLKGLGGRAIMSEIQGHVDARGLEVSKDGLQRHLTKHIRRNPSAIAMVQVAEHPDRTSEDEQAEARDYHEMWELYSKLRAVLDAVDPDNLQEEGPDGEMVPSTKQLAMWVKLVSESRAFLSELHRMRVSDRLTRAILIDHTNRFIQYLADPLATRLEAAIAKLRRGANGDEVADDIQVLMEDGLVRVLDEVAHKSLEQSCQTYRVH